MKWCPTPRFMAVVTAALLISLLAVSGFAQFQSGNIYGKVQAKDGSVLPGVTVVLTGFGAPQTAVTDAAGNFRFLNLSPGAYALKAELAGRILELVTVRKLTQKKAAAVLGIDQPKVSALMRGKLDGFSTDRLFRFLNALGQDVEIVVRPGRDKVYASTRVINY